VHLPMQQTTHAMQDLPFGVVNVLFLLRTANDPGSIGLCSRGYDRMTFTVLLLSVLTSSASLMHKLVALSSVPHLYREHVRLFAAKAQLALRAAQLQAGMDGSETSDSEADCSLGGAQRSSLSGTDKAVEEFLSGLSGSLVYAPSHSVRQRSPAATPDCSLGGAQRSSGTDKAVEAFLSGLSGSLLYAPSHSVHQRSPAATSVSRRGADAPASLALRLGEAHVRTISASDRTPRAAPMPKSPQWAPSVPCHVQLENLVIQPTSTWSTSLLASGEEVSFRPTTPEPAAHTRFERTACAGLAGCVLRIKVAAPGQENDRADAPSRLNHGARA
jgi:hypothetical protein